MAFSLRPFGVKSNVMKISVLIPLALTLFFAGCNKEKSEVLPAQPTPYYVKLTDAPGPYLAVNVDIQAVEVTGSGGTISLNTTPGIYNLLDFSNGTDTLIAYGAFNMQKVEQIRLILGDQNSIVTSDSVSHPLKTPSAQQSGLKLKVNQVLEAGVAYYVLLDFDAAQSVVEQGNGSYLLKPVIRTVEQALSGAVKGKIYPPGVFATVTLTDGNNSYSGYVNANGEFIVSGVPAGTYTLTVTPSSPFSTVSIPNVTVANGVVTNVGVISI